MANRSCNGRPQGVSTTPDSSTSFPEPEVRRWPHPVVTTEPPPSSDTAMRYIHCALSYQNQLLADIKTHLEQLIANTTPDSTEK